MRVTVQDPTDSSQQVFETGESGFQIGRHSTCEIQLNSPFVSGVHARIERGRDGWELQTLPDVNPIMLNGHEIAAGTVVALPPAAQVRIAEYVLLLEQPSAIQEPETAATEREINEIHRLLHDRLLRLLDLRTLGDSALAPTTENLDRINTIVDELLTGEFHQRVFEAGPTRRRLLDIAFQLRLEALLYEMNATAGLRTVPGYSAVLEDDVSAQIEDLCRELNLELTRASRAGDLIRVEAGLADHIPRIIAQVTDNVQFYVIAQMLKKMLCDMVFGLGPLQDLLDMPEITEIMVVHPSLIYIERDGLVVRTNRTLVSSEVAVSIIERIVSPLGRRIDRSQPLVDARLADGSRLNAVIPPLAIRGPCLTIRRFPARRLTAADLVEKGSLPDSALALLEAAVRARKNIIVAGGTGSGKTSLLNVLSALIPSRERIVTIEDSAELQLQQEHVITLETRPPNAEGKGAYTIRDLVRNALRMRPDRIVVGECRGGEALDMLQAMNTGHDGSMTTIHANSARDVMSRLETMVLMAVDMPIAAVRGQIGGALDLVVFLERRSDGRRLVTQISEVTEVHPVTGELQVFDIMNCGEETGADELRPTGYMPSFLGSAVDQGLLDLDRWFARSTT